MKHVRLHKVYNIHGSIDTVEMNSSDETLVLDNSVRIAVSQSSPKDALKSIVMALDISKEFYPMIQASDMIVPSANFGCGIIDWQNIQDTVFGKELSERITNDGDMYYTTLGQIRELKNKQHERGTSRKDA